MKIVLGFAGSSAILPNCSPCKVVTSATYNRIGTETGRMFKILSVTRQNLENQRRLFYHCIANGVDLFRLSAKIIPYRTDWDFYEECQGQFDEMRTIISDGGFSISTQTENLQIIKFPEHLLYLDKLLEAFGVGATNGKIVTSVSGAFSSKQQLISEFCQVFEKLPERVRHRLVIRCDGRIGIGDGLKLSQALEIPVSVNVLGQDKPFTKFMPQVLASWDNQSTMPQLYAYSVKNRKISGFVDSDEFCEFLEYISKTEVDCSVIVEGRSKDAALFTLKKEIGNRYKFENYKIIFED